MDYSLYEQVVSLKDMGDKQKRGYLFEQILREIQPWSFRPPIVIAGEHEQIDAFYQWNGWIILLEAKAKEGSIMPGSHDWEDFELKLRKRGGSCIGLFCSLYPISNDIIKIAENLNRQNFCTIILHSGIWEQLAREKLPFSDLLQYMILHARAKNICVPPELSVVRKWCYDRKTILINTHNLCKTVSSTFLRRHKHPRHSEVYVFREIDEKIKDLSSNLIPSKLMHQIKEREDKTTGKLYSTYREKPIQIFIIRDSSGAGKTTFSVQTAITNQNFFGIARAALENDIDNIGTLLNKIGINYGIQELISINQPVIYVVDSLDEASSIPNKNREVLALLRFLDDLNELAKQVGLTAFPLGLVFTIREDYWRTWESIFEGLKTTTFRKQFSQFTIRELDVAIDKYSSVYNYSIIGTVGEESRPVLSIPFNLQIFSEANEYCGAISISNVLSENVLHLFFSRKREDILKRGISAFDSDIFIKVCANLAMFVVEKRKNMLSRSEILQLIKRKFPLLNTVSEQIATVIVSEQILVRDSENALECRFRHSKFIEYLLAYYIILKVDLDGSTMNLDTLTTQIFDSGIVSMYCIHDFVRYICRNEFQNLFDSINSYYAKSYEYMNRNLSRLRNDIAFGEVTSENDIKLILKNTDSAEPKLAWNSFFVMAARNNNIPDNVVIDTFEVAWKSNKENSERWKLISKLSTKQLLLNEKVIIRIIESECWKEWQVYLGYILYSREEKIFSEIWDRLAGEKMLLKLASKKGDEWLSVNKLLKIILQNIPYIPGEW